MLELTGLIGIMRASLENTSEVCTSVQCGGTLPQTGGPNTRTVNTVRFVVAFAPSTDASAECKTMQCRTLPSGQL